MLFRAVARPPFFLSNRETADDGINAASCASRATRPSGLREKFVEPAAN